MTLLTPTATTISLTPAEFRHAALGGALRQIDNLLDGLRDAHGLVGSGFDVHAWGAAAEDAVAKYLGAYWSTGERGAADVGAYQVRYTSHAGGRLIVHPSDADNAAFVLVTGGPLRYTLAGWCWGWTAKHKRYWCDPTGKGRYAYFVPQSDLSPMAELPAL